MNFQVPQFIEIEDKIFGPLSLKQFLYVAGGAGLSFILYVYLPFYLAILPIAAMVGLTILLAFYKYNERPFISLLESAFRYSLSSKLYIWRKDQKRKTIEAPVESDFITAQSHKTGQSHLSDSRLKDLAWSLDIKDVMR